MWSIVRVARDFLLFMFFMRSCWPRMAERFRKAPLACSTWLAVSFLATVLYTVLFGKTGIVGLSDWAAPAKVVVFTAVVFLLSNKVMGLSVNASLLESLLFTFTIRSCQMLYTEAIVPVAGVICAVALDGFASTFLETVIVACEGLLLLWPLSPKAENLQLEHMTVPHAILLSFVFVEYIVFKTRFAVEQGPASVVPNLVECVGIYVFCLVIRRMVSDDVARMRAERMSLLVERQYADLMRREKADRQLRTIYHDLKHAISLLELQDGYKGNEAGYSEALTGLADTIGSMRAVPYTQNVVLNMVLNQASEKARSSGVRFEIETNLGPCDILDGYDAVTLFGNALSNAFEAVGYMDEDADKWVRFEATQGEPMILFRITNPYVVAPRRRRDGALTSSKPSHPEAHGLGLISISSCAKKYGGIARYEAGGGIFVLTIAIPAVS